MYYIIGADGKEYGPVTSEQLRQWIAEGRVNDQTKVRGESSAGWQEAGTLPELAPAMTGGSSRPAASPAAATAKTSGLAIASLVCGILGIFTCGITALVGLILGIVALVKINNSQGRLSGRGFAIAGVVVSSVLFLLLPIFAAMLLPALAKARVRAQTVQCVNNARQLCLAVRMYSIDHKDTFPSAERWCDAITNAVGSPKVFQCSADPGSRCAFAFNAKLGDKKEGEVNPQTVMIFESNAGWNASGDVGQLEPHKHSDSRHIVIIGLADGSVQQVKQAELGSLRWDP